MICHVKEGLPKSTIGEEIKKEKVTPNGNPALVKPINNGIEEHEQNGLIGNGLSLLGQDINSRLGGSIQFFLYDVKIGRAHV